VNARRIPINVPPVEGEALDSWLEAIAHRTQTSWGDLLTAVGLGVPPSNRSFMPWLVAASPEVCTSIHQATGLEMDAIADMTLSKYDGSALAIADCRTKLNNGFPWGPRAGSRFCPGCLKDSGGRWSLSWRLSWTFVCLKHRMLLADRCPECRTRPRVRARPAELIPAAERCAAPAPQSSSAHSRCGADLTAVPATPFVESEHPALTAQRWINGVLAGHLVEHGVLADMNVPPREVLDAVRTIAVRTLSYATAEELEPRVPADLMAMYIEDHPLLPTNGKRSDQKEVIVRAPRSAALAAVGVLIAQRSLASSDVQSAGDSLRWLISAMRSRSVHPSTTNLMWSVGVTRAVQLAALGPTLKPSDQLRYRTGSKFPAEPTRTRADISQLVRKIPTALWQCWSLPLSVPGCHHRQLRSALSVALLLVGSNRGLDPCAQMIRSPVDGHGVSRVLQLLQRHPCWDVISRAIAAAADYLHEQDVPIDYKRRRSLDYTSLLPDSEWLQICRATDTAAHGPARAVIARHYLWERLSGGSISDSDTTPALRTKVADFPYYLTPELCDALDEHGMCFLESQGVTGEPVHYEPVSEVAWVAATWPEPMGW
jgi:hypothetical protein